MGWIARALFLLALLAAVGGCGGYAIELRRWTLETADGRRAPIELPTHVNDAMPSAPGRYSLRTHVDLPDALRGRPLVLAIPRLLAHASLRADGRATRSLERDQREGYRTVGPKRWEIDAAETADGALDLELEVKHTWTQSGWLDTVPLLGASALGGARFALIRTFNDVTVALALGLAALSAYSYLVVFLTDRRRAMYGWFALTGLTGALYPLFELGLFQVPLGAAEVTMAGVGVSTAVIANLHFTCAHFGEPRPARAWWVAWFGVVAASCASTGYFTGTMVSGVLGVAIVVPAILVQTLLLVRLARRSPRPPHLFAVLAPWTIIGVVGIPDFVAWLGMGELLDGVRPAAFGIFVIGLLQATVLSREHTAALRTADVLAAERAARIRDLEARNRDVEVLNDELRRQIASRSRQLADALTNLGTPGDRQLVAGDVIDGRYEVVREIGAGAGGTVYLVHRLADREPLAMKIVRSGEPTALARLAREAQLAAQTKHPNVISIVDVEVASSGFLYVVMEFVSGASLRESKARFGDVPWATSVLAQVAMGLAAIHARGIVHRDLKPANVLLVPRGADEAPLVKIADFGIARGDGMKSSVPPPGKSSTGQVTHKLSASSDARLTMTGMLLGTPLYMAPEAIGGARDATTAVDMFAFGVMAFELYTGGEPFSVSPALAQLEGRTVAPATPLAKQRTEVPREIARIVDRCLSFEPDERPTASEAAACFAGAHPAAASIA